MSQVLHTPAIWVNSVAPGLTPLEYFETKFKRNLIGGFKVQASIARYWNLANTEQKNQLTTNVMQLFIDIVVNKENNLRTIPFNDTGLLKFTREFLLEGVCLAVQEAIYNNNILPRSNGSNISTPSWTITVESTPWAFKQDPIGLIPWTIIENSKIRKYKWVGEGELFKLTPKGNIQVISQTDTSDLENVPRTAWDI